MRKEIQGRKEQSEALLIMPRPIQDISNLIQIKQVMRWMCLCPISGLSQTQHLPAPRTRFNNPMSTQLSRSHLDKLSRLSQLLEQPEAITSQGSKP